MLDNTVLGAQTADPMRFRRLRLRIVLLGVLVVVAFAGASAYDAWRSYKSTLSATHREITNVAAALAEQTAWTFQGVDLLLRDTARWYQNDSTKITPERLNEVLANRSSGVRQIRMLTITDPQGIQIHRSRGSVPPHFDVSDRSYFIAQRDGTAAGLFMSEALITRSEGQAGIVLSRRLEDESGAFAGVVTASSTSRISRNSTPRSASERAPPCSFCATTVNCWCAIRRIPMPSREAFRSSPH
jgi:hypothetical protein